MKGVRLFVFLFPAMLPSAAGEAYAQTRVPKADTQSWNDVQLTIPLGKKVDFLFKELCESAAT